METKNVEAVAERTESNGKNEPFVSMDLWPLQVAIWENKTQNGGKTYRVQLSVSRLNQEGDRQVDSVYLPLRDTFAASSLLRSAADQALRKISVKRTK